MRTPEDILKDYFGHTNFRGTQKQLIDALLEGRDVLGVMPTGAGKSVCYQIPALLANGLTLVISPLISLMKDQVGALEQAGIRAACLNSTMSADAQRAVFARAYRGELRLLYVAPERLNAPGLKALFERIPLAYVAVDEAHCISQWGQDFRPSYGKIVDFLNTVGNRPPVGAFTATATAIVRQDIEKLLGLRNPLVSVSSFDRANLTFLAESPHDKREHLITLVRERAGQSGIIYCSTRKAVDEIHELLLARGFFAGRYHAGLDASQRRAYQDDFQFDRTSVIVATNAFGMGIDKSNVSFVIHYNMPQSIENYYQEAGRAGRDGAHADCILLYSPKDVKTCEYLIEHGHDEQTSEIDERTRRMLIRQDRKRLEQMDAYATTTRCLRSFLLGYFGETAPSACNNCSSCLAHFDFTDATLAAQKIVSCVFRLKQRGHTLDGDTIVDILRGADCAYILQNSFETLSTYAIMLEDTETFIRSLLDSLIADGYLERTEGAPPTVSLCAKSNDIIRKHVPYTVKLPRDRKKVRAEFRNSALYEALRAVRAGIAARENTPAYMIFTDATLRDMCIQLPATTDELLSVPGVVRAKTERYGGEILRCIKQYAPGASFAAQIPTGAQAAMRIAASEQESFQPWTRAQDDWLHAQAREKLSLLEISNRHERPLGSVLARMKKLGLPIIR